MVESSTFAYLIKVMSQTTIAPLVEVNDISLYEGKRLLLEKVSLALRPGEIVSIIGPNGAGKTTLVKAIVGLLNPSQGIIRRAPGLRLGYMPQKLQIDRTLPISVRRFLCLGQQPDRDSLASVLRQVGVTHVLDSPLTTISGGEFQRVLLARALLRQPQLLVLDEPVQGVDLVGQAQLYDLIAQIRDTQHCAILLVSHDLNVVMAKTDIVVCLNRHVCCTGDPEKVSRDPAFTALFGTAVRSLAFYTHHHDHQHTVQGQVIGRDEEVDHEHP